MFIRGPLEVQLLGLNTQCFFSLTSCPVPSITTTEGGGDQERRDTKWKLCFNFMLHFLQGDVWPWKKFHRKQCKTSHTEQFKLPSARCQGMTLPTCMGREGGYLLWVCDPPHLTVGKLGTGGIAAPGCRKVTQWLGILFLSLNFLDEKCSITVFNARHKNNVFHEIPAIPVLKENTPNFFWFKIQMRIKPKQAKSNASPYPAMEIISHLLSNLRSSRCELKAWAAFPYPCMDAFSMTANC